MKNNNDNEVELTRKNELGLELLSLFEGKTEEEIFNELLKEGLENNQDFQDFLKRYKSFKVIKGGKDK